MSNETTQAITVIKPIAADAAALQDTVDGYLVTDEASLASLADLVKQIKLKKKALDEKKSGITKPLNDSLKATRDLFRPVEEQIDRVLTVAQMKMNSYIQLQEQIRAEEEREQRQQAAQEAAAAHRAAEEMRSQGAEAIAAQIEAQAATAAANVTVISAPARGNFSTTSARKRWTAEIVNQRAFFTALANGDIDWTTVVDIKQGGLNEFARKIEREDTVAGIRVYQEITAGVR